MDDGFGGEAVQHLQALLRIDTTNPPGNETAAAEYLAGVLSEAGYEPVVVESAPGRGNLVVRYRGTGEEPPLLIYGHMDVVTAEPEHWTHAPFSGDSADGYIWGRGALDMKSMVAQELMVMLALTRDGRRLRRDVIFAATADEEVGGEAGMGFLVDRHPDLVRADYGLSEGGGTTVYVAGKALYDVRTAEKGTCRFRIRAQGAPGHGSIPRPETSVRRIAQAVESLYATPLPFRPTATAGGFFSAVTAALGLPERDQSLDQRSLEIISERLPPDLRNFLAAITHDTAVPTGLRAGKKINVIPSEADALVDGRYLPGQTPDGFFDEVRRVVGEDLDIEPTEITEPLESPPGGPLYETIIEVMGRQAPEARVVPTMLAGATDAKHVARLGTHCLGFGPLRVKPGFPADSLVHGHDERIPIEGYIWGTRVLYEIVTRFCS